MTHREYGISALVSQRSFGRETGGSVSKRWLFSQAIDSVDNSDCYCFQCQEKKYDSKSLKTFGRWSIDGDHFTVETADNNNNKTLIIFIKHPFPRVQKVLYAVKFKKCNQSLKFKNHKEKK